MIDTVSERYPANFYGVQGGMTGVVFLLHCDTGLVDAGPNNLAVTRYSGTYDEASWYATFPSTSFQSVSITTDRVFGAGAAVQTGSTYITIGSSSLFLYAVGASSTVDAFTFEGRFKFPGWTSTDYYFLFSQASGAGYYPRHELVLTIQNTSSGDAQIRYRHQQHTLEEDIEFNYVIPAGILDSTTYHHIALSLSYPSTPALWVDGTYIAGNLLNWDWNGINCDGPYYIGQSQATVIWGYNTRQIQYDEVRWIRGFTYGSTTANIAVPYTAYSLADSSFGKVFQVFLSCIAPASNALISVGDSTQQFNNLWIDGKAYIDGFGESTLFDSAAQLQFRSTNTYIWSSGSGFLTLVGAQIDLQGDVGLAAHNFIFDTATGVKVGTATNQKLAFWGSTPIVQPTANGTFSGIKSALVALGLISSPTTGAYYDLRVTTTSAAYLLSTADDLLVCEATGIFSVTVPAAVASGKSYVVKNIGTANVTLSADSADLIDGAASKVLSQWEALKIVDVAAAAWSTGGEASTTKVLLHFDGAEGGTVFTESMSSLAVTRYGAVYTGTAKYKFSQAALFASGSDYITVGGATANFNPGSGLWMTDFWVLLTNSVARQMLVSHGTDENNYWKWDFWGNTMYFSWNTNGSSALAFSSPWTVATGTWIHLAIGRVSAANDSTGWRVFVNGNAAALTKQAGTWSNAMTNFGGALFIGKSVTGTTSLLQAWMDEFRFVNGTYSWNANFTVATVAYTGPTITPGKWLII